jgi:hypothetical protein
MTYRHRRRRSVHHNSYQIRYLRFPLCGSWAVRGSTTGRDHMTAGVAEWLGRDGGWSRHPQVNLEVARRRVANQHGQGPWNRGRSPCPPVIAITSGRSAWHASRRTRGLVEVRRSSSPETATTTAPEGSLLVTIDVHGWRCRAWPSGDAGNDVRGVAGASHVVCWIPHRTVLR